MLAPISGTRKDGRSSFRALKDYLAQEVDSETGEIRPRGEIVLSASLLSLETAAAEMRGVANENARVKDPVYHYQLCWADAAGRIRREKAGVKSAAVKLYQKRKTEILEEKKLPEQLRGRVVRFAEIADAALAYCKANNQGQQR